MVLGKKWIFLLFSQLFLFSFQTSNSKSHIRCDGQNAAEHINESTCQSHSDNSYACCFLSANLLTQNNGVKNKLCVPISARSSNYPEYLNLGGVGYNVNCPSPIKQIDLKSTTSEIALRGEKCGPSVTYDISDCSIFSDANNSCCLGKYTLTDQSEDMTCIYYGSEYKKNEWETINIPKMGGMTTICDSVLRKISLIALFLLVFIIL